MRTKGAFLVSAQQDQGIVSYVNITSEKGQPLVLINPWQGSNVSVVDSKGEVVAYEEGTTKYSGRQTIEFATTAGETYYFVKGEDKPAEPENPAKADKSALETLLSEVSGIDLNQYTDESVNVFKDVLAKAQAIMEDDSLTKDEQKKVDDAVKELTAAKEQLILKDNSGNGGNEYKIEIKQGISEVPESFKSIEHLNTPSKIVEEMKQKIQNKDGEIAETNIAVYDVKLLVNIDGQGWTAATKENFPADGLTITLPYPPGTGRTAHDFTAAHMFTEDMNGFTVGDVEYPVVIKTEDGITFKVHGLSPISVGWKERKNDSDGDTGTGDGGSTGNTGNTGDGGNAGNTGNSGNSSDDGNKPDDGNNSGTSGNNGTNSGTNGPKTGDAAKAAPAAAAVMMSLAVVIIAGAMKIGRKRR